MSDVPRPGEGERQIGLEHFLTTTTALGGVLKKDPEDFVVDEIPDLPMKVEDGPITIAKIKVSNWETNRLVRVLSKNLSISRFKIKFAGTKDKRAVSTRLFSFDHPIEKVLDLRIPDLEIIEAYTSNRELELGNLMGNHFNITIRDVGKGQDEMLGMIEPCLDQIISAGGFPNYFGIQRFGAMRPITHIVGKHIVHGDAKSAVMTYVGNPHEGEPENIYLARKRLEEEMDFEKAVSYYPVKYLFERSMIHHMKRRPDDWAGALDMLPDNLKMMFVHAYQSYIFNRILSERISAGLPLNEPILGDLVIPLNKKGLPDHHLTLKVNDQNIDNMTELVKKRQAFVSGAIIGMESGIAEGQMGDIESRVIEKEGISEDDFKITIISRISSKGMRRELLAPVFDLKWRFVEKEGLSPQFDFSLYKGTYATSFLRELIKGKVLDY
ncbi:MAG: tRNA pseudouridine(13) synthase TruD [Candidatus Thermoplasmatota archaeon]|nr:tRNA pseudouridine(13) synthase TruD [Candidatus Thermoplasmatota archaeon]